ncbi:uncharacterized protein LOC117120519 [Anneissia japonica]|uniref:uncharacterized protein LOC117120519 n=1 Tax=Anneissia japonica TaxID=1529436 RepID=UPI0014256E23|nr:uncharacterized protein LOC117120519 [Anneissia japonica]
MGKTTLLKYIAHQWATDDEHVFADKLLFLINIREIKTSKTFLDIILNKIDCKAIILKNNLSSYSVERFLVIHDDKIVFLLDGYDELERNSKDPIDLFNRSEFQKSMVVITSRPDNTADLVECCDVHIEVKGFSPSNIKKYIQNYFHSISEIKIGDSLIKEFGLDSERPRYWDRNHKEAFKLCSSPLLLLNICTIWEVKRVLPTYLPDLFKELICCILNQYLNRPGNKTAIANFERIPDKYISAFLVLGECMYTGLKKNILSIDKYDLSKMAKNEELLNLALEFGFVYEDTPVNPGDVREMYTPPHKLMSEALAGLYLSTEIQKGSSKVEYEEIRCNYYLNMTRVFAIGFLGADADKLLKPWLIVRASHYRSIIQCLAHVKKEHEDDILLKLDNHMTNDMKAHNKQMLETFKSLLNDDLACSRQMLESSRSLDDLLSCIHLLKFLKMTMENPLYRYAFHDIQEQIVFLINRCRERRCKIVAHTLLLLEILEDYIYPYYLLKCISTWDKEEINLLSAEMEKHHLKYDISKTKIYFKMCSTFLIHLLKYASDLEELYIENIVCNSHTLVTGAIHTAVINDLDNANIKLVLEKLDISGNDLNDIDGTLLGKLFKIAPKLKYLNLRKCRLSGGTLRAMITECQKSEDTVDHVLKHYMLVLEDKDLSDIDGTSVADLVRVDYYEFDDDDYDDTIFILSDYSLTFDNIEKLVESVGENITLVWESIDLSRINLSSVSGITLARLFKICPDLMHINMSYCSLSSRIVNEMMEECCRMNVVLKDNMLSLKGNDLSDIDGKSLAELVMVVRKSYYEDGIFSWSDYSLTAGNLEMLVESVGENITLNWDSINLSGINLSSISGKTLACVFKISPHLIHIDMSNCSLSGRIVNEMMEECCRINVVLKDNMLSLKGNDLSDIDGTSLAELFRVICQFDSDYYYDYENGIFSWSDYFLTAGNLEMLVESVGENITLNWEVINLSRINLSSISGKTLARLFKISPDLDNIDMSYCSLSGRIVNEMMEECCRINVVLKDNMLSLKGNDLSDIDGTSLAELVRVICQFDSDYYYDYENGIFSWSDYFLTAGNLEMLVESVGENITLNWEVINLSRINLSSVSGKTLARLFKISPDLDNIDMSNCSLSGRIVNEMMEECCRIYVVLKDNMLSLKGNDLSDIDGKSLAELVRVVKKSCDALTLSKFGQPIDKNVHVIVRWSDYSLKADNLEKLVESVGENITLNWQFIDLSNINLSSISGRTLACLVKISPDMIHIDMSYCSLSGRIVNEMFVECSVMNAVLDVNMLNLQGNNLSDVDGKLLAEIIIVLHKPIIPFIWSGYFLTADNLEKLVESVAEENITLNWQVIDLSNINLSSISGRTLACLVKISPDLVHINMSYCSLSGRIVYEMIEECCEMNVVLEKNMLNLGGNDISDIVNHL